MAKKVAKKTSATKKSIPKVEPAEKQKKVAKAVPHNLKKLTISKTRRPDEHCFPNGRVGVPVAQINYVKTQVYGPPTRVVDNFPWRRITNLFGDYTSLSESDFQRLKNDSALDNLFTITYANNGFTWKNFAVACDESSNKYVIQCDQLWPPINSKSDSSKKSSIHRKRKLDPFLGDIEISITWPDCDGSNPDPATTQQITIKCVSISPYIPPS